MAISLRSVSLASVKPCSVRRVRPVVKVAVVGEGENPFDASTWKSSAEDARKKEYPTGQSALKQWEVPNEPQDEKHDAPWVELAGDGTEYPREKKAYTFKGPADYTAAGEEEKEINESPNRGKSEV